MTQKYTQRTGRFSSLRRRAEVIVSVVLSVSIFAGPVQASTWKPTALVNTEAFQSIDDSDSSSNVVLKFGDVLAKTLTYNRTATRFEFSDAIYVTGNAGVSGTASGAQLHAEKTITSSGSIVAEGNIQATKGSILLSSFGITFASGGKITEFGGFNTMLNLPLTNLGTNGTTRLTNEGNLANIGSIQSGEISATMGGTFGAKTDYNIGLETLAIATGDLNGDGKTDVITANNTAGSAYVLLNAGVGSLGTAVSYAGGGGAPNAVTVGDVNGDGKMDFVLVGASTVSVFMGKGNGTFATKVDYTGGTNIYGVALADVNGDGKLDIGIANYGSGTASVLLNNGDGTFAAKVDYTSSNSPQGITFADISGDGKPDMLVGDSGGATVFINKGNGTFAAKVLYPTSGGASMSIIARDLNGDGKVDMALATQTVDVVAVFLNSGTGSFATKVDYAVGSGVKTLAAADINGDGKIDLATANNTASTASVLINKGNGTFAAKADYPVGSSPTPVALADLNGDGKADLLTGNQGFIFNAQVSVLLNNAKPILSASSGTGGTVGIGTATPGSKLSVSGSVLIGNNIANKAAKSGLGLEVLGSMSGSALFGAGLTTCNDGTTSKLLYNASTGKFSCGTDQAGGGGGSATGSLDMANMSAIGSFFDSPTIIDFDTENFDIGGIADTSTDRFTIQRTGYYLVTGGYWVDSNNDVTMLASIHKNGSTWKQNGTRNPSTEAGVEVSDVMYLEVGDYIEFYGECFPFGCTGGDNRMSVVQVGVIGAGESGGSGSGMSITTGDARYVKKGGDTMTGALNVNITGGTPGTLGVKVTNTLSGAIIHAEKNLTSSGGVLSFGNIVTKSAVGTSGFGHFFLSGAVINEWSGWNDMINIQRGNIGTKGISRLTNEGNLQNIGSIQSGEINASIGGTYATNTNYTAADGPAYVAIGDVNGDGKADIATANRDADSLSVFLNTGTGSFAAKVDYATGVHPLSVALGDVNGDGKPDLALANGGSNTVSVFLNKGNGSFAAKADYATGGGPFSVVIGDINTDGKADLAVANFTDGSVSVLLNAGNGTFGAKTDYTTGSAPKSVAMGDVNGDGKRDLAVANSTATSVSVLLNTGNGTFGAKTDYTTASSPYSVAMGDLNGDNKADLAVANNGSASVSVFLNTGTGGFAAKVDYTAGSLPSVVTIGDVNGDGKADLLTSNFGGSSLSVLLNKGSGTFATKADYTTGGTPNSIAVGDVNGDGKADLATVNYSVDSLSVVMNINRPLLYTSSGSGGVVGIGTATPGSKLSVSGSVLINANGNIGNTSTDPGLALEVIGTMSGSTIHAEKNLTSSGTLSVEGASVFEDALTFGDAISDAITVNASTWTFANDTNFVLNGGVNGLSFDTATFSVDAQNDRVGINTTAPKARFEVVGTISGSLLRASNLTVSGAVLYSSGTTVQENAKGFSGQLLISRGTGAPEWKSPTGTMVWYLDGTVAVGGSQGAQVYMPFGFRPTDVKMLIKGAPTGSALIGDLKVDGSTIFSVKPQINAAATSGGGSAVFNTSIINAGTIMSLDITQAGSTFAGSGLTVLLNGSRRY